MAHSEIYQKYPGGTIITKKYFSALLFLTLPLCALILLSSCSDKENDSDAIEEKPTEVLTEETDASESVSEAAESADAETEAAATEEQTTEEESTTDEYTEPAVSESVTSEDTENIPSEIRPDFKQAMDSYEEFINEYVDFLNKYEENPADLSILADYARYMSKYSDFVNDFEKWEDEDLNLEEAAYYLDVQARVNKKLLKISE